MNDERATPSNEELFRRIEQLERDNARLRDGLDPGLEVTHPCFHPREFVKVLNRTILLAMIPLAIGLASMFVFKFLTPKLAMMRVGPIPVMSFAGTGGKVQGLGLGLISFGGMAVGVVAVGGFGFGLIAFGGCAVGIVSVGGGSFGVIAFGGGAFGVVAVGGGATGYFAMGQKARGKYALGLNRQDQEAIDFFVRYIPGLRRAVTNPMPVIPLEPRA